MVGTENLYPSARIRSSMDSDFQCAGSMALQDPQGHAAVRIPHPQGAVQTSRDQQGSITCTASGVRVCIGMALNKGHTKSEVLMPVEYLELLTRLNFPERQTFVSATGHDMFFVGAKGNPLYIIIMPLQDLHSFPCSHIPHPSSVIIRATGQEF